MRTLLIPTDFDLKSLNSIPNLVRQYHPAKLNIILVHLLKITDSMQELLMLSRRSTEYRHISDKFYNTCTELKQKYADNIADIRIEFFYGSTLAVFKNFLDANGVDVIVTLKDYDYQMLHKNSIEPTLLVNRSGIPILNIDWQESAKPQIQQIDESLLEHKFQF